MYNADWHTDISQRGWRQFGDKMDVKKGKPQPTKWESSAKCKRRRITLQEKIAIRNTYDSEMGKGPKSRDDILHNLGERYDVSTRQIERYIEEVHDLPIEETCDLIRRWIVQVKGLMSPPQQLVRDMVRDTQEEFLEPWAKHVILSPELNVPIESVEVKDTEGIHCMVEEDILFTRLRKHLDVKLWKDYERFTRRVFQYEFTCLRVFSELVRLASQVLEKLGCSTITQTTFAKTVFEEAINPSSCYYYDYAVKPPAPGYQDSELRYGHEPNPIAKGSSQQLAYCLNIHKGMRENMRERFRQGFQPTQLWKEIDELKIDLVGQLERLLRQFELPSA